MRFPGHLRAAVVLSALVAVGGCGDSTSPVHRSELKSSNPSPPRQPYTVTVYGSAREVSGALSVVDLGDSRLMVDCGAYYPHGEGDAAERNARAARLNGTLPPGASDSDYLAWTHAHLDHIGRTPLLVRSGFQGQILATQGTAEIAPIMLRMQIRYEKERVRNWTWTRGAFFTKRRTVNVVPHWHHECRYAKKIRGANRAGWMGPLDDLIRRLNSKEIRPVTIAPCKECANLEVAEVMKFVKAYDFHEPIPIGNDAQIEFRRAGHIPGSASILLSLEKKGESRRVLFSGDLGNHMSRISPGPEEPPIADLVFVETTYGTTRRSPEVRDQFVQFRKAVSDVVEDGGIAWIPAFALDRTQKVLFELRTAQKEGVLSTDVPIYCPSPSAGRITQAYKRNQTAGWFSELVADDERAFEPDRYLGELPKGGISGPAVIVSTSGMMESAFSGTLAPLLQNPKNAVFLVGYQDPNSPGGALKVGKKLVAIESREHLALAKIRSFRCFSGHGDAADIDVWLSSQQDTAPVVLVHGESRALEARVEDLSARRAGPVQIAEPGQHISLLNP